MFSGSDLTVVQSEDIEKVENGAEKPVLLVLLNIE